MFPKIARGLDSLAPICRVGLGLKPRVVERVLEGLGTQASQTQIHLRFASGSSASRLPLRCKIVLR